MAFSSTFSGNWNFGVGVWARAEAVPKAAATVDAKECTTFHLSLLRILLNARERFLFAESKKRFSKLERKFKKEPETAHRELRQRKYVRGFLLKSASVSKGFGSIRGSYT